MGTQIGWTPGHLLREFWPDLHRHSPQEDHVTGDALGVAPSLN